ncbi:hypothetical protein G5B30_17075, partial [Sphingobacterium sp. SGG-5]|uniref:hypothetical protein n=1 Tax=Sphingobacterium sp. SGG-5 TaxID=2710881 RepID=UPI0013ED940C
MASKATAFIAYCSISGVKCTVLPETCSVYGATYTLAGTEAVASVTTLRQVREPGAFKGQYSEVAVPPRKGVIFSASPTAFINPCLAPATATVRCRFEFSSNALRVDSKHTRSRFGADSKKDRTIADENPNLGRRKGEV